MVGLVLLDGLIGSILLVFIYCKVCKIKFIDALIPLIIVYPLIYSISKIACYISGCCYSNIVYEGILCQEILIEDKEISVFPIQLVESFIMFVLFSLLLKLGIKNKFKTIVTFIPMFCVIRFIVDYFRYSRNIILINLTLTQLICIFAIIMESIFIISKKIKK